MQLLIGLFFLALGGVILFGLAASVILILQQMASYMGWAVSGPPAQRLAREICERAHVEASTYASTEEIIRNSGCKATVRLASLIGSKYAIGVSDSEQKFHPVQIPCKHSFEDFDHCLFVVSSSNKAEGHPSYQNARSGSGLENCVVVCERGKVVADTVARDALGELIRRVARQTANPVG